MPFFSWAISYHRHQQQVNRQKQQQQRQHPYGPLQSISSPYISSHLVKHNSSRPHSCRCEVNDLLTHFCFNEFSLIMVILINIINIIYIKKGIIFYKHFKDKCWFTENIFFSTYTFLNLKKSIDCDKRAQSRPSTAGVSLMQMALGVDIWEEQICSTSDTWKYVWSHRDQKRGKVSREVEGDVCSAMKLYWNRLSFNAAAADATQEDHLSKVLVLSTF